MDGWMDGWMGWDGMDTQRSKIICYRVVVDKQNIQITHLILNKTDKTPRNKFEIQNHLQVLQRAGSKNDERDKSHMKMQSTQDI
jgi:hypothetical protein